MCILHTGAVHLHTAFTTKYCRVNHFSLFLRNVLIPSVNNDNGNDVMKHPKVEY